jgi:hypothetical protein
LTNFLRVLAAPSAVALCLSLSCSDPPSPPAQAAVTFFVGTSTGSCPATHAQLTVPGDSRAYDAIASCDLASGCHPDDYVVVDRDQGTGVSCTVSPRDGGNFQISLHLQASTPKAVSFNVSGIIGATGGSGVTVTEADALGGGINLKDPNCTVEIVANHGQVNAGSIWAHFKCSGLAEDRSASGSTCSADGYFLFENCGS